MIKSYWIFPILFAISFLTMSALYMFADKPNGEKNGFKRKFQSNPISLIAKTSYTNGLTYICGVSKNHLYFNTPIASQLIVTDYNLKILKSIDLNISINKIGSSFYTIVDSPLAFIVAYNLPAIIKYDLNKNKGITFPLKRSVGRSVNVSKSTFSIRCLDSVKKDEIFKKISIEDSVQEKAQNYVTERNGDGGLSTDGFIYYDSTTRLLCYTFFYQNGFVCMDTNLNMVYKAHSIDTMYSKKTIGRRFITATGESSFMLSSPPKLVNMQGCVARGHLYLRSGLQADNEKTQLFFNSSVIDVYNLKSGKYEFSFHLPNYEGTRATLFKVFDNLLVAIYGQSILLYKMEAL